MIQPESSGWDSHGLTRKNKERLKMDKKSCWLMQKKENNHDCKCLIPDLYDICHDISHKATCLNSRYPWYKYSCFSDFYLFPCTPKLMPMQPAAVDTTFDLSTRYPLGLDGARHFGMQSLSDTAAYDQRWESDFRSQVRFPIHLTTANNLHKSRCTNMFED